MSQAATTRVSRARRPSEKQTQQIRDKEEAAERRIREAERAEKRRKHRQRDEEAKNWDPEHDDLDEDEPEIEYSDDEGDTIFTSREVPSYLIIISKVLSHRLLRAVFPTIYIGINDWIRQMSEGNHLRC